MYKMILVYGRFSKKLGWVQIILIIWFFNLVFKTILAKKVLDSLADKSCHSDAGQKKDAAERIVLKFLQNV